MFMYSPVADPGEGPGGPPVREQSVLLRILNLSNHLLYSIEEIQLNVSNISPKYRFEPKYFNKSSSKRNVNLVICYVVLASEQFNLFCEMII